MKGKTMKSEVKSAVKFTPGPWIIKDNPRTVWAECRIDGIGTWKPVATASLPARTGFPEANTNARLIAAAPDLLEACKALLEEWKSRTAMIESCDLTEEEDRAVELAESAITKATGGAL